MKTALHCIKTLLFVLAVGLTPLCPCAAVAAAPVEQTVIDSDGIEWVAGDTVNTIVFTDNVRAKSPDMTLICDRLEIIAHRAADSNDGTVGKMDGVESIVATGHVRIEQAGRAAEAGRAEVKPSEGLVVLTDHPCIIDSKLRTESWKIVYNSKSRTLQMISNPDKQARGEPGARSRVILSEDALPALNYESVTQDGEEAQGGSSDASASPIEDAETKTTESPAK